MNKKLLYILLMLCYVASSFANDGVYYTSGNQLVPLNETDISVKKEVLTITILDNSMAKVDVYYEFFHPGTSAKKVMMGFEADPPYVPDSDAFSASGIHPYIKDFTVEANGQTLNYKNGLCEMIRDDNNNSIRTMKPGFLDVSKYTYNDEYSTLVKNGMTADDGSIEFAYVYYFDMTFRPGKNIVHHTYQYTMSSNIGTGYIIDYKLSPAARWANKQIDDFTLVIRADNTAKHFTVSRELFGDSQFTVTEGRGKIRNCSHYDMSLYEFSLRNGAVTLHKNNFRPSAEKELSIAAADAMYTFNDHGRCGEYYDRKYCYPMGYDYFYSADNIERKQKISRALYQRIIKNLPYADRGHVFKDATLKKYFSSLWWYMPDASYNDDTSDFTDTDWEFIKAGKE